MAKSEDEMNIQQIAGQIIEWMTVGIVFMVLTSVVMIYQTVRFLIKISKYEPKKVGTFGKRTT